MVRSNECSISSVRRLVIGLVIALVSLAALRAADTPDTQSKEKRQIVSMIDLIANKEKYHGKAVALVGYYRIGEEESGIYLSKEHAKQRMHKDALWVSFERQLLEKVGVRKYSGKYVLVWGVFNMNERGHGGMKSGGIEQVSWIREWPSK